MSASVSVSGVAARSALHCARSKSTYGIELRPLARAPIARARARHGRRRYRAPGPQLSRPRRRSSRVSRRARGRSGSSRRCRRGRSSRPGSSPGTAGGSPRRSRRSAPAAISVVIVADSPTRVSRVLEHRRATLRAAASCVGTVAVDAGAVLRADVVALAHALRRVVVLPEDAQHLLVARLRGIEHDEHDLVVPGAAAAHLFVGRDWA